MTFYRLSPGVTVRKESFGLLFYNAKDTNLTFVNSGNLLDPDCFYNEKAEADLLLFSAHENNKILRIVKDLLKRGVLVETKKSL